MLRQFYPIEVSQDGDYVTIRRLFSRSFNRHLTKLFGETSVGEFMLFGVIKPYIFERVFSITFHQFFLPEIYFIFKRLYEKFHKNDYKVVLELLVEKTFLNKLYLPDITVDKSKLSELGFTMSDYQAEHIDNYANSKLHLDMRGAILAFDQGMGKTSTALANAYIINPTQTFIVCPLSLIDVWIKEIRKMIPGNPSIGVVGDSPHGLYKYVICNYERVVNALPYLNPGVLMIVDESHNIRYLDTKRAQALTLIRDQLNITDIMTLSGTPVKALASELIPMFILLDPRFNFEARRIFKKIYASWRPFAYHILKYRLSIIMDRKMKADYLDLPPKHFQNIAFPVENSQRFTLEQMREDVRVAARARYHYYLKQQPTYRNDFLQASLLCLKNHVITRSEFEVLTQTLDKFGGGSMFDRQQTTLTVEFDKIFNVCIRWLKWNNKDLAIKMKNARTVILNATMKAMGEALGQIYGPRRVEALVSIVNEHRKEIFDIINKSEKKVIMFCTSVKALNIVDQIFTQMKVGHVLTTGETKNISAELDKFMQYDDVLLLLASFKMSTGVTLVNANTVIFLDQPYRDADYQQAQDRVYRRGQDTDVYIINLFIDTGDTPNITTHSREILEWSANVVSSVMPTKTDEKNFGLIENTILEILHNADNAEQIMEAFINAIV